MFDWLLVNTKQLNVLNYDSDVMQMRFNFDESLLAKENRFSAVTRPFFLQISVWEGSLRVVQSPPIFPFFSATMEQCPGDVRDMDMPGENVACPTAACCISLQNGGDFDQGLNSFAWREFGINAVHWIIMTLNRAVLVWFSYLTFSFWKVIPLAFLSIEAWMGPWITKIFLTTEVCDVDSELPDFTWQVVRSQKSRVKCPKQVD